MKIERYSGIKKYLFGTLLLMFSMSVFSLTDTQVLKLLEKHQQEGTPQSEVIAELLKKGITIEQLKRVEKQAMEVANSATDLQVIEEESTSRMRDVQPEDLTETVKEVEIQTPMPKSDIFGQNLFAGRQLSFEPNLNLPTPENYVLGAGDEVLIDIWGNSEFTVQQTISPDGTIVVENVGVVYLSGLQIREASQRLKSSMGRVYSDLLSPTPGTFLKLSLGKSRSIHVNLMGEVSLPGTYTMSAFATVFHALYMAGGVSKIGTLRNIKVFRKGKLFHTLDVYQYLMKGEGTKDVILQDADVILVGTYDVLVDVKGLVRRPMKYEMKKGETVSDLIGFAGGFAGGAYTENVRVNRKGDMKHEVVTVQNIDYAKYGLKDGDEVSISSILDEYTNKVEVTGAVYREGIYAIDGKVHSVKSLVEIAGGVKGDAFLNRVILYRQDEDMTTSAQSFNLADLLAGKIPDIELRKNDFLYISSLLDSQSDFEIKIRGSVKNPDNYHFKKNMKIEDAILMAGGLLEYASTARVDVYRRIKNPGTKKESEKIADVYTFSIQEGDLSDDVKNFTLEPYDEVFVFRSPGYEIQENVTIEGEVLFPGTYAKLNKQERISSFIKRAGGLTSVAYAKGCRLIRQLTDEEKLRMKNLQKINEKLTIDSLALKEGADAEYIIGINLEKILKDEDCSEGKACDLILRAGDRLVIPVYSGVVKVSGAVSSQSIVIPYIKGGSITDYIYAAGGYDYNAAKRRKYIIYLNGSMKKLTTSSQIQPGCEIVIPTKSDGKKLSTGEIISITSGVISMSAVISTLIVTLSK